MVFKKNYTPWNKGLTKDVDKRVFHSGCFGIREPWNKGSVGVITEKIDSYRARLI